MRGDPRHCFRLLELVVLLVGSTMLMGLHLFDAYFINYLPSYLSWQDVLAIVSLSLALSFLATIYPAIRAAKIQPAEALRYE